MSAAKFWEYEFDGSADLVETFDETPLWSAAFGLLLLKHLELKPNLTVLDIGSGAGFPLLELAERLGHSCRCFGLDPWTGANARARKKIQNYGVKNAEVLDGAADKIPFDDGAVDLIVSNLGINNFDNADKVFTECGRVLKAGGRLALTTNLNGHWKEFYEVFEETLRQTGKPEMLEKLRQEQMRRGTIASVSALFTASGFEIKRHFKDEFAMKFLTGTAFFNHHFVKLGWLSSWRKIIPRPDWTEVFTRLEENLNEFAAAGGGLNLTVPMAFIEGEKL